LQEGGLVGFEKEYCTWHWAWLSGRWRICLGEMEFRSITWFWPL